MRRLAASAKAAVVAVFDIAVLLVLFVESCRERPTTEDPEDYFS